MVARKCPRSCYLHDNGSFFLIKKQCLLALKYLEGFPTIKKRGHGKWRKINKIKILVIHVPTHISPSPIPKSKRGFVESMGEVYGNRIPPWNCSKTQTCGGSTCALSGVLQKKQILIIHTSKRTPWNWCHGLYLRSHEFQRLLASIMSHRTLWGSPQKTSCDLTGVRRNKEELPNRHPEPQEVQVFWLAPWKFAPSSRRGCRLKLNQQPMFKIKLRKILTVVFWYVLSSLSLKTYENMRVVVTRGVRCFFLPWTGRSGADFHHMSCLVMKKLDVPRFDLAFSCQC